MRDGTELFTPALARSQAAHGGPFRTDPRRVIPMAGNEKKSAQVTMVLNIFVDSANKRRIHKWTAGITSADNGSFTYDNKPGFQDNYSCDPDSADYDPANYNRCLTWLHEQGISLDVPLAPLHSRRLRDRWPLLSPGLKLQIVRKLLGA
jgi:hypothetical protein